MKDDETPGTDGSGGDAPFSEMMRRWLDEGDQLSESVATGETGATPTAVPRRQQILAPIRELAARYRLPVLAGIGMLPLVIFTVMHRLPSSPIAPTAPIAATPPRPLPGFAPQSTAPRSATTPPVVLAALAPAVLVPAAVVPTAVAANPVAARVPAPSERQLCESELRRERVAKALSACRRVADAEPSSADALVLLARANLLAGRQNETLRLARLAAGMNPRCADAFLLIGNVEQTTGRKPDARAAYQAYLRLAPRGAYAADVRAIVRTL